VDRARAAATRPSPLPIRATTSRSRNWPQGKDDESRTATLTCDPNGGTHPDPAKGCAALDAHPEALHPVPGDMACTQIYGGDQVALIEGDGVHAVLNRSNGCEIARWDALAPVLELLA
jgi:hypothetical protein